MHTMTDDARSISADSDVGESAKPVIVTLRIPSSLNDEINQSAKTVGLKQADVLRLALMRGLPVVVSQLNPEGSEA